MTRRKFSSKFKTKVVLEALQERMSMSELARKFELQPQQIVQWKKEFLSSAEEVFDKKSKDSRSESEKEKSHKEYAQIMDLNLSPKCFRNGARKMIFIIAILNQANPPKTLISSGLIEPIEKMFWMPIYLKTYNN